MRRARLILNPSSGRERGPEHLEALNAALRGRFDDVATTVTSGDGDAERAAVAAAAEGCDALFVAGGDGTVNEAMNGLSAARALADVAVGIIPFGTGNDFAAALGIPTETDAALGVLLEGREVRVDLGQVNGRVFVNTSGGGLIGEVSVAVTPQLKTIAGRLAYLIGGAQALLEFDPVMATVTLQPGNLRVTQGALRLRRLQLAPDRRRPPDCAERGDRRRAARRLPDRVDERAGIRRPGAEGGRGPARRRSAGLATFRRAPSTSSWRVRSTSTRTGKSSA